MKSKNFKQLFTFILVLLFSIASFTTFSQDKRKVLEISTYSFDQFGIRYKFGNENYLFRISSFSTSASFGKSSASDTDSKGLGTGVGIGIEFPKQIKENFTIYYGSELRGSYNQHKYTDKTNHYDFSLNGIFGITYNFNEILRLGAELTPGIYYSYNKLENGNTQKVFRFGIENYGAALVLGFCF